jgi:hypothetical protein
VIFGIDSNIVVYAGLVPLAASSSAKSAEWINFSRRAKILLHELRDQMVVLPMIAVAEVLVPVPVKRHGQLIATLKGHFLCAEFGDRAATIAADLWARYKNVPPNLRYDSRFTMLADVKIIASAKAVGATVFYTNDENCQALADLVMQGKGLPKNSSELFIDEILADGIEEKPKNKPQPKTNRGRSKK